MQNLDGPTKWLISILFFPSFFQTDLILFAWGQGDPEWVMILKRVFLLLPVCTIVLGLWTTLLATLSIVVRERRRKFSTAILLTWWDLGRAVLLYWAGMFKGIFVLAGAAFGFVKLVIVGFWYVLQDILLVPFRMFGGFADNFLKPGTPWIAVALTLIWCLIESVIFTYVMTPLVTDTLANLVGETLATPVVRIPLFLFMLFLILGSYAVLSTWTEAVKSKNYSVMIRITVIEMVAILVEVLFLYREFVDSLVPWFAQHASEGFELGIIGTLLISFFAWLGVRGMSWFLFAQAGTPTIMAIIQGSGLKTKSAIDLTPKKTAFSYTAGMFNQMKNEIDWIQVKGEEILGAFILPPLQILGCAVNFCTLVLLSDHVFGLPFRSVRDIADTKSLLKGIKQ